ncbi:hypothetical protein GCM10023206_00880 [Acinetobacter puyangensis]|uniref:Prepilin-type N-terminal cleavage/methylation domain-containing protein n=1 Tax=Acinetobacter puyangensis TaxID=1096779 RepID=A0A240E7G1_9GAMM|nr:prepilin-type N-terminal cleavage/methylation domain-containing protein [Acinetobacter puyangensis]SNX44562.1 prepilin-type N-terminal cleavage/methylation domain-containing protein [Acinetobacter puyangensis]
MNSNRLHQSGFALLESLIAMVIIAIVALGTAFALSKILQVQRQSSAQQIAVNQLREKLQTGVCDQAPSPLGKPLANVSVACEDPTIIKMDGDISVSIPQLTVTDDAFGGEMTVGGN